MNVSIENESKPQGHTLRKGRVSLPGQIYLITTVTHNRTPLFTDLFAGRCVVCELAAAGVETLAYVIMPDHLHWLLELRAKTLPRVVQQMKSRSAIAINKQLKRSGAVWQHGYHDHALRKDEDIRKAARYGIANPLRASLTDSIGDYSLWDAAWV